MDYCCNSYKTMTRRNVLQATGAGLATLLTMSVRSLVVHAGQDRKAAADHVILLWMSGGMSHVDTFDPKPDNAAIAGEFKSINTSADGIQLGEILPLTAKQMKHASLVRSLHGAEGDHGRATYNLLTNYRMTPQLVHPSLGSVVVSQLAQQGDLPAFVSVSGRALSSGYLGQKCEAYYIGSAGTPDPYAKLPDGLTQIRAKKRLELLQQMNKQYASTRTDDLFDATQGTYAAADKFMHSPALKAFDLDAEKPETRAAYGDSSFGRGCLLARRLVDEGVRFVQVNLGGFDTHSNNFTTMRRLGGIIDPAIGSLLSDLAASGKLDRTLVLMMSEFGRTPTINSNAGRDHHPGVFSALLAGGGLKKGTVFGASDADARKPKDQPVTPGDIHATICHQLGIDPETRVETPLGRPMRLVDEGTPIKSLLTG